MYSNTGFNLSTGNLPCFKREVVLESSISWPPLRFCYIGWAASDIQANFIASSSNSTLNNRANIESKDFGADLVVLSYFQKNVWHLRVQLPFDFQVT